MGDGDRSLTVNGSTTILPGHEAGKANMRRYFGMLGYLVRGLLIAALALAVVAACMAAARIGLGLDLVPTRVSERLATIDPIEIAAMLLGLALALTTGVPMGMYLLGLMAGYEPLPFGD